MWLDSACEAQAMTTPTTDSAEPAGQDAWVASFGPFRLSAAARLLDRDGVPVHLGGRALSLLIALVGSAGQVISKKELIARVWPDVVVEEGSLRVHMVAVRKALGDGQAGARYVTNVTAQGYCFVAPVTRLQAPAVPAGTAACPDLPNGLSAPLTRIVGRDATVQAIQADLLQKRFVTIVGPGGIGKTTVAVSAAHAMLPAFEGAARFIDLAPVNEDAYVSSTLAATLGLLGHSGDAASGIVNFLRDKRMLLVLDSCEHVIGAVAELAERIFQEAPNVHILATSREALRVEGEQVHRLLPLACPPASDALKAEEALAYAAVQLFVDRAAVGATRFELGDADAPAVAKICRELDGIALAIELAAGRLDAYGVQGIAALLNKSITVLWHGRRTAVPRHQTMSATLEWSYNLLTDVERAVLRRLSVFVGVFSLEAARFVAGQGDTEDAEVVEAVANLVSKSLLTGEAGRKAMRYRMLDSTRVYALRKLIECGETFAVASRHASHYRSVLEGAALPAFGTDKDRTLFQQAEILGNVRAALDWSLSDSGDVEIGTTLAAAAAPLLLEMSPLSECRAWMEKAIASLGGAMRGTRREMELQASLGQSLMFTSGNSEEVRRAFWRGLELAEALEDLPFRLRLLGGLGTFQLRMGDFRGALELARLAESVAKRMDDPVAQGTADSMLGVALDLTGDIAEAEKRWEAALKGAAEAHRTRTMRLGFNHRIHALCGQARCHWLRGECDHAAAVAQYAIEQAEMLNHPVTLSIALIWAGSVFLWRGDCSREEEVIERLLALATKHSLSPYVAVAMGLRGEVQVKRGRPDLGVNQLRDSLQAVRANRYEMRTAVFITALAEGLNNLQQHAAALAAIEEAITLTERQGGYLHMPETLRVKGEILASTPGADSQLAEQCLLGAIQWSQRQSALSWELRASNSLSRLWLNQGRIDRARRLLAPVYGRFTEGHGTADLVTARELLAKVDHPSGPARRASRRSR
ncbi:transcriptional regulator [Variovorax sp. CF079]|nr:transcriptional regulator [Variovorax sp. CF079]